MIFSPLWRILTFLARQVYWQQMSLVVLWEGLCFFFTFEGQFHWIQNSTLVIYSFFFFEHCKYFTLPSSCLHAFWKIGWSVYLCFSIGKLFISSDFFKIIFILISFSLNMICLSVDFLYLSYLVFSHLFQKILCPMTSNISSISLSLSSTSGIPITHIL